MTAPLLVGVIGHRELPRDQLATLAEELRQALAQLRRAAPDTPIHVVSSLAVGADQLGARVALEAGYPLVVALPCEQARFETDFPDSVGEFRTLMDQAHASFVVGEGGESGYVAASGWMARHCQVLIALWDGDRLRELPGGTAHTVALRTQTRAAGHELGSISDYLGPVLHLHAPRASGVGREPPRWIWPSAGSGEDTIRLTQLIEPLQRFNQAAAGLPADTKSASAKSLLASEESDDPLVEAFAAADALAIRRQRQYRLALQISTLLAVLGYAMQHAWPTLPGRIAASLLLTLALAIVVWGRRKRLLDQHLEYRSLAEVLRVAWFWRMAGITTTPTDQFLNQHWGNLRWIRAAVNALWMPRGSREQDLDQVKKHWVDGQNRFYRHRSLLAQRRARLLSRVALTCFVLSVCFAWFGTVWPASGKWPVLLSGIALLLASAVSHYTHSRGWQDDGMRYAAMATPFGWCSDIWIDGDAATRQRLVEELGCECVAEVSSWLLLRRTRPLDLIRG